MSLPRLDPQRSFFETEEVFARLGKAGGAERFRFFAERIWPQLVRRRPELEKMYCADNGRPAEEPVRMLSVLILQFMERMPDRQAAEACQYDLRWKLALGMEVDEPAFTRQAWSSFGIGCWPTGWSGWASRRCWRRCARRAICPSIRNSGWTRRTLSDWSAG